MFKITLFSVKQHQNNLTTSKPTMQISSIIAALSAIAIYTAAAAINRQHLYYTT